MTAAVDFATCTASPTQHCVQALNEQLAERLQQQMSRPDAPVDQAAFISVDRTGADVRLRRSGEICVQRLGFLKVWLGRRLYGLQDTSLQLVVCVQTAGSLPRTSNSPCAFC